MKKLSLILIAFLALSACSTVQTSKAPVEAPEQVKPDPGPVVPVDVNHEAIEILKPVVTVTDFINNTATEKERNLKAIERLRETVRGQCFQKALMERSLIQTGGKTNAQVVQDILSGDVKVKLAMYRSLKKVVGYTYPMPYDTIHCNRKYHDNMDPCDVAANLIHEVTHKMGYTHDFNPNKQRPFSVPYSVGTLMDQCCQEKK